MKKFLTTLAIIGAIGLAIWISALLFIGLAVVGAIAYGLYFSRGFLIEKGILNPTPGIAPEEQPRNQITIDGDFTKLSESEKQD